MTKTYPTHHGSPYDRGRADAWYGRSRSPHRREGLVEITDLDADEVAAYQAGYQDTVDDGCFGAKWG